MRIVQAVGQYEGREREAAWVFRIAHNLLVDHQRRRSRRPAAASSDVDVVTVRDASVGVDLKEALGRLEGQDRHAFLLCELGGLRYDEIAGILGLTTGAVRSRIFRARQELRQTLLPPRPVGAPARVHTWSDANAE